MAAELYMKPGFGRRVRYISAADLAARIASGDSEMYHGIAVDKTAPIPGVDPKPAPPPPPPQSAQAGDA